MTVSITEGSGPPDILIAQLGTAGTSWKPVVDRLGGIATFTYDRPGTGNAPARPAPNPALPHSVFADELADILDVKGITEPAVIVGHSVGGLIARLYAARHPHRVAGLVLIDSSTPPFYLYPETRRIIDGDGPDATEIDTVSGHVEVLEAALPAVPALVVSRSHGRWDGVKTPPHPAVEDLWRAYQRRYATELGCPRLVADNSGHQLQRDATALVAYAIRAVHAAARTGRPVHVDHAEVADAGGSIH
jgi:pimeloyl-ACP methyl ester carboxylesterase